MNHRLTAAIIAAAAIAATACTEKETPAATERQRAETQNQQDSAHAAVILHADSTWDGVDDYEL